MTWTKLDDGFWSDPEVISVGNEAAGAYCRMLTYCGQHSTDGHVPDGVARFITRAPILQKLSDSGWIAVGAGGWIIPNYLKFNPSRDEVEERRKVRAEAGRRGGLASGKTRSKG